MYQAGSSRGVEGTPEASPEHAVNPPPTQAEPSPARDKPEWDELPEGHGWRRIIEEEPDD